MTIEFCIINKGYNYNYSIKYYNKDIGRISLREYRDIVYIESTWNINPICDTIIIHKKQIQEERIDGRKKKCK